MKKVLKSILILTLLLNSACIFSAKQSTNPFAEPAVSLKATKTAVITAAETVSALCIAKEIAEDKCNAVSLLYTKVSIAITTAEQTLITAMYSPSGDLTAFNQEVNNVEKLSTDFNQLITAVKAGK